MSCDCKCYVALPSGAVGWSAVCDCNISWSYSFTFFALAQSDLSVCYANNENFVLLCTTLCPFQFCNHLEEEEKVGCFAIIVLQTILLL